MRTKFERYLLLLWYIIGLAGCTPDSPDTYGSIPPTEEVLTDVQVTLTPDFVAEINARSFYPTVNESLIRNIWVIQLNSTGTAQLQDPQFITFIEASGNGYKIFIPKLVNQPGRIYFLVNTHNINLCTPTNVTTTAAIEALTLDVAGESSFFLEYGIPMTGTYTLPPAANMAVTLSRALSKVTLNLTTSLPAGQTFTLTSVQVCQVPNKLHYYRNDLATYPYPATTELTPFNYTAQSYNTVVDATHPLTEFWYLPENGRGTGSAKSEVDKTAAQAPANQGNYCTYLLITGTVDGIPGYTNLPFNVSYKIFLGADNVTDYNLIRNKSYTINTVIKSFSRADSRMELSLNTSDYYDYTDNYCPWFFTGYADAYYGSPVTWSWMINGPGADRSNCPAGWSMPLSDELTILYVYNFGISSSLNSDRCYWSNNVPATPALTTAFVTNLKYGETVIQPTTSSMSYNARCIKKSIE